MLTRISAMNLAKRTAAATVVCGALVLGTAGAAFAAGTNTSGSTPAARHHFSCTRAPKALTRINNAEAAVAGRLSTLQAAESKATDAGRTALAARIEKRILRLEKAEAKAGALVTKIQNRCPTATAS